MGLFTFAALAITLGMTMSRVLEQIGHYIGRYGQPPVPAGHLGSVVHLAHLVGQVLLVVVGAMELLELPAPLQSFPGAQMEHLIL